MNRLKLMEYSDKIHHPMLRPTGDLPPCDKEVFEKGKVVALIRNGSARLIERFVSEVREASGERVDWQYTAGVGVVRTLGNVDKVQAAIDKFELNIQFVEQE